MKQIKPSHIMTWMSETNAAIAKFRCLYNILVKIWLFYTTKSLHNIWESLRQTKYLYPDADIFRPCRTRSCYDRRNCHAGWRWISAQPSPSHCFRRILSERISHPTSVYRSLRLSVKRTHRNNFSHNCLSQTLQTDQSKLKEILFQEL